MLLLLIVLNGIEIGSEPTRYGARLMLLIVLNGIEIELGTRTTKRKRLLIVLNGIEMYHRMS